MAFLTISTWLWGDKYNIKDVVKLINGVRRHLQQPHRFLVMTERERDWSPPNGIERHDIQDRELLAIPGCFARLRMFDRGWQDSKKIDGRLVCMDLDSVVLSTLDPLFDRPESFVILGGANSVNPCPYNGSLMMLRTGYHEEVWTNFSIEEANKLTYFKYPDDQGWLAHKLPGAAVWKAGWKSGVVAFQKPGWPHWQNDPPAQARLVVFPGARQPHDFKHLPWVRDNWR